MNAITLETQLTPKGVVCSHPVLGQVATISRDLAARDWYVMPYRFPPSTHAKHWDSMQAAEFYALALAYEQMVREAYT